MVSKIMETKQVGNVRVKATNFNSLECFLNTVGGGNCPYNCFLSEKPYCSYSVFFSIGWMAQGAIVRHTEGGRVCMRGSKTMFSMACRYSSLKNIAFYEGFIGQ